MKSEAHGKRISRASVRRIARTGIRVEVDDQAYFLRYIHFPWFKEANSQEVREIELIGPDHLRWPALDIDLSLESIRNPDRYPLISRDPCRDSSS